MPMNDQTDSQTDAQLTRSFCGVTPSLAADAELTWFFNDAETAIEVPSNLPRLLVGLTASTLEEEEERMEAKHAADWIRDRLLSIPLAQARTLEALYLERPWPRRVERALGELTGPVEALPVVRAEHLRALARGHTSQRACVWWLDELVKANRRALEVWRPEAELACAVAITAYERVRGRGASVVPVVPVVPQEVG